MAIPQKLKSTNIIRMSGIDLRECSNLTVVLQQGGFHAEKEATVLDASTLAFTIEASEAEQLKATYPVTWQVIGTDANAAPIYTKPQVVAVDAILLRGGAANA